MERYCRYPAARISCVYCSDSKIPEHGLITCDAESFIAVSCPYKMEKTGNSLVDPNGQVIANISPIHIQFRTGETWRPR